MAERSMDVTIAICTWNRARLLEQALKELCNLQIPSNVDWNVLVVDNNSTDETPLVVDRYRAHLPLRSVFVAQQGKAYALNAAVDSINSELILWTDDDALVAPGWLSAYVEAARRSPDVDFWGGAVEPYFEQQPPAWLLEAWPIVANAYGALDPSGYEAEIGNGVEAFPIGANWAVRTMVQKQFRYDLRLGPNGHALSYGDETAVIKQLLGGGHKGHWCREAKVRHFNARERTTEAYLRRYFFGGGRSHLDFQKAVTGQVAVNHLETCKFGWRAIIDEAKYRLSRHRASPRYWVRKLRSSSRNWGLLAGYCDQFTRAA